MLKKLVLTLATGAALAGAGTTALAQWAFDDPYWKQALDRSSEPSRMAAAPRETVTDAGIELRFTDSGRATAIEADKARLNDAGFPQYNN